MAARKFSVPGAAPFVSVGRITEQIGKLRLINGHGSDIPGSLVSPSSASLNGAHSTHDRVLE
jgi:hypothetical protein